MADYERRDVLCCGSRLGDKNNEFTELRLIDGGVVGDITSHFSGMGKGAHGLTLNCVYAIDVVVVDGSIESCRPKTATFVRILKQDLYNNRELAAANRAMHDSTKTALASVAQAKKAANDRFSILSVLKPLRKAYSQTNAQGKLALEVRVLNYLRTGKDL